MLTEVGAGTRVCLRRSDTPCACACLRPLQAPPQGELTPLHIAAAAGDLGMVQGLLAAAEASFNVDAPNRVSSVACRGGRSALQGWAALATPCGCMRAQAGWTALHFAAAAGSMEAVRLLLRAGASVAAAQGVRVEPGGRV